MTAQQTDIVQFELQEYELLAATGSNFFAPADIGITPGWCSTSCYRGYVARFRVDENQLLLTQLEVVLQGDDLSAAKLGEGPLVAGVVPIPCRDEFGTFQYQGLDLALTFSGGLLLGSEHLGRAYVPSGYHGCWYWSKVVELVFTDGVLEDQTDWSDVMAEHRATFPVGYPGPLDPALKDDIDLRMNDLFEFNYGQPVARKRRGRFGAARSVFIGC